MSHLVTHVGNKEHVSSFACPSCLLDFVSPRLAEVLGPRRESEAPGRKRGTWRVERFRPAGECCAG